jgi:hypothetical protein
MTAVELIKIGQKTALISFLSGTAIFGFYIFSSSAIFLFIGYFYIVLAGLVNIGALNSTVVKATKERDLKLQLWKTCGLMLFNFPIMLSYCWVVCILLNTMRITFTNSIQTTLTNIDIVGCGGGWIDKLDSGESQTVWIHITGDCSIKIRYSVNGQVKEEEVAGYVTNNTGEKMKYIIGGENAQGF